MITQERLKELLHYDPETGVFVWKISPSNNVKIGSVAGGINQNGYCRIMIASKSYFSHRLAWLFVYGYLPLKQLDHIDHNTKNNLISNLREVNHSENQQNLIKANSANKSGFLGVITFPHRENFQARINIKGKQIHLGMFDTPEEAHQAYLDAKRKLHSTCTI